MTARYPSQASGPPEANNSEHSAPLDHAPLSKQHRSPIGEVQSADEQLLVATSGACAEHPTVCASGTNAVQRGLSAQLSTKELQGSARLRVLMMLNRFRVMRTIDVAVLCYPERPFKAALTAAQRAVRGMVKEQLIRRYKSDRFQTIYGLTARGAKLLQDQGHEEAAASVRRVADMTNPEHRLWLQLLVLAAEARALRAETEQELLRRLNRNVRTAGGTIQGLLRVNIAVGEESRERVLRPDALISEQDGATWLEVDRSKRGAEREASLRALSLSLGTRLLDGQLLRRVVVFCKNERIEKRAITILRSLANAASDKELVDGRCRFKQLDERTFEVHKAQTVKLADGRLQDKVSLVGYIVIQLLPVWLPKARINKGDKIKTDGWMDSDYLPYYRFGMGERWPVLFSPLVRPPSYPG